MRVRDFKRAITRDLEKFWSRTGMSKDCAACIKGPRGGCCHGCKYLGPTGCTYKPIGCAFWMCSELEDKYPKHLKFLETLIPKLTIVRRWGSHHASALGLRRDYKHPLINVRPEILVQIRTYMK